MSRESLKKNERHARKFARAMELRAKKRAKQTEAVLAGGTQDVK
jgi:hypothetical protein